VTQTARLAQFVAALDYGQLPPAVVRHAKLCILDGLACGLYGSTLPWGSILAQYVVERGGPADVRLWGRQERVSLEDAVLVNGTFTHSFELDDLHPRSILHPAGVTIPVILALVEAGKHKVSGKQVIAALVAGYEAGARVGMSVGAQQLRRGFHPTGTVGPFAAAAAAANVLGLSPAETAHALGTGGTFAAGLMASQYASMVKRMHAGRAAQNGLVGALLARRGFTGIDNILEAEYGGFCSTFAETPDMAALNAGLGEEFETMRVGFKPYCCCGSNHTSLDAVKSLMADHGITKTMIRRVTVHTTRATKLHVGWEYKPDSITTAQMNLYYCLAVLLEDGELFVDQFKQERLTDPQVLQWIPSIQVIHDPKLDALGDAGRHAVRVEMELRNGSVFNTEVRHAWGSAHRPMSEAEVRQKFVALAERVVPPSRAQALMKTVDRLEELDDAMELAELL